MSNFRRSLFEGGKTNAKQTALSLILSVTLLAVSLFTGVSVLAEEGTYTANRISIHPGIDDTILNFTWQSTEQAETASVRIKAEGAADWTVFTGESKAFAISEDGYEEGYHDTFVKNCGHTCSDICGHEACTASQTASSSRMQTIEARTTFQQLTEKKLQLQKVRQKEMKEEYIPNEGTR